jgi:hypothetical protein
VAYALPFELLVSAAWDSGVRWLPGQLLETLAEGGAAMVTYGRATLLLASDGVLARSPARPVHLPRRHHLSLRWARYWCARPIAVPE